MKTLEPVDALFAPVAVEAMARLRAACHPACIGCRSRHDGGLGLRFDQEGASGVVARFDSDPSYQGYPDRLHGGIIATLLDAAMTHSLFARRVRGYTVKMEVRYRRAVTIGVPATVRAQLVRSRPPWFHIQAEVLQQGEVCASARAVFNGRRWGDSAERESHPIRS
jgi:acyl-coenzyme A thioesterase PaaI-like protein